MDRLSWLLFFSLICPLLVQAQLCESLFKTDEPKTQIQSEFSLPALDLKQERNLWKKAVTNGRGTPLDAITTQIFLKKWKKHPEFANDVLSAITDPKKRFEFLFALKTNVVQRLAREGTPEEIMNYQKIHVLPERILTIELMSLAAKAGFKIVMTTEVLKSGDFAKMMSQKQIPVDGWFKHEDHGHLIHILQLLQIAHHIDKKYKRPGTAAEFYLQLSQPGYQIIWKLFFDDQYDPATSPEIWNMIYRNYLNWDF